MAVLAGVSLKTASRVINEERDVAPETVDRVRAAARELRFRPNRHARSLAAGRTSATVGLLIPEIADPFVAALVGAVERVLATRELQLITASHGDDPHRQRQLAELMVERRVDALLLMSAPGSVDHLEPDVAHGLIVVALDRPLVGLEADTVIADNDTGTREAVEALLQAGHRRIAAVALDGRLWTVAQRVAAYRETLRIAGMHPDERLVSMEPDPDLARAAVRHMLMSAEPPTAALATSHAAGRVVMRAAHEAGAVLDLAVFDSLDDNDLLSRPPLVSVASGPERIGRLAAELALARMDGSRVSPLQVILPTQLVGRDDGRAAVDLVAPPTASLALSASAALGTLME